MSLVLDRLMKNARIALPGSLDNAISLELFNVLDQFFRDSGIWTEEIPFTVLAGDPVGTIYYIEPAGVSSIVRLIGVRNYDSFRQRCAMFIPGEVTFLSPPSNNDADVNYWATVVLSIVDPVMSDGYPEFPEWIVEKYGIGILDGVLGRMMAQPAKPYTNRELAIAHLAAFRRTISHAGTESLHGNVHNAQAWVYPQSFRTRSRR